MAKTLESKDRTTGRSSALTAGEAEVIFQKNIKMDNADVVIASGDMAFITDFAKAIVEAHKQNPKAPIVLCGGINKRYNILSATKELALVGFSFGKATGLSPMTVTRRTEAEIMTDILTSDDETYKKAREKMEIEKINPVRILSATGAFYGENMQKAREALEKESLPYGNVLLVGAYHASRLYRYALREFGNKSNIGYKGYVWKMHGVSLVPDEVKKKSLNPYNRMARNFAKGELDRLKKYSLLNINELNIVQSQPSPVAKKVQDKSR